MKRYIVIKKQSYKSKRIFNTKEDASSYLLDLLANDKSLTLFDLRTEEVDFDYPLTFEEACRTLDMREFPHAEISERSDAFYHLCIIAEAWNKVDNFVPDHSNRNQQKWYVYLDRDGDIHATRDVFAIKAPFFFKRGTTAHDFGIMFKDLFKEMYGIK